MSTSTAARSSDASNDHANPAMGRPAATQQETIDRIADEANDVRRRMHGAATSAAATAKGAQDRLVAATAENLRKVRSHIERNPLTTVGIAFVAGVLLSRLIRR